MHRARQAGILQARILEWFAISFSRESSRPRDQTKVCFVSKFIYVFFFLGSDVSNFMILVFLCLTYFT